MVDQHPNEGSSTSYVCGENSNSTLQINVKTLDSQVYSFQVNKNMLVSLLKEKIANAIGVPVGQRRLIFKGKVLKDDHLLSEYDFENGDMLHLVVRQPPLSQPPSDMSAGETNGTTGTQGHDANAGVPHNWVGQNSRRLRVILGIINPNTPGQVPQGNEADGTSRSVGSQSQVGGQAQSGQAFSGQPGQTPVVAAAVPIPSLDVEIPNSLNTLSDFMYSMEATLFQNGNGYLQSTSSTSHEDELQTKLPTNERGLPTPEALSIVMRHHLAGRLEQEGASLDPTVRGQIQAESVLVGIAMGYLGSLLLELGRVILTLCMGQSPSESSVTSGPAVYISPSRPNPLLVQPDLLHTSSVFGRPVPSSIGFGVVGGRNAPMNINIHIHSGTTMDPVVSAVGTRPTGTDNREDHDSQIGIQAAAQSTESSDSPEEVLLAAVERIERLQSQGNGVIAPEHLEQALHDDRIVREYMELLEQELVRRRRLAEDSGGAE